MIKGFFWELFAPQVAWSLDKIRAGLEGQFRLFLRYSAACRRSKAVRNKNV